MFLIRPRFWLIAGIVMLVITAGLFSIVAIQHKRSQDESRSPHGRTELSTSSETWGYYGAFASGLSLIAFVIAFILWIVRSVLGIVF